MEDTFDGVPISVSDASESEAVSIKGSAEPRRLIDEERGVGDLIFLAKFIEKHPDGAGDSRRK